MRNTVDFNFAFTMVHNPDITRTPTRLSSILIADLTPAQLDTIQHKFGIGANLCCPYPSEVLFIEDKREWSSSSHADLKRAYPDADPLIVIDSRTPSDGGIWYIERFATGDDVENEQAENTNTLFKIRMRIEDIVIQYANYSIANTDIREDLDTVDIPYPTPENFDQEKVFGTGFDYIGGRYINPTWVVAVPEEMETSTDPEDLKNFAPPPSIVHRLKPEIAKRHGLKNGWTIASDAGEKDMPGGSKKTFPDGSKVLQLDYDPETAMPRYERPEGSL
jgi:hypothetical protein